MKLLKLHLNLKVNYRPEGIKSFLALSGKKTIMEVVTVYKITDVNDENNVVTIKENLTLEDSKQFVREFWKFDAKELCEDLDKLAEGESYPIGCGYIVTKGGISMNIIGSEFIAQKSYPLVKPKTEFSYDIVDGETVRIIEKTEEGNYKLLNLSLDTPDAWVIVTLGELLQLKGHRLAAWNIINETETSGEKSFLFEEDAGDDESEWVIVTEDELLK